MNDVTKRSRVTNEQLLAAIMAQTTALQGLVTVLTPKASEPAKPTAHVEVAQSVALVSRKSEEDGPEMKAICANFGLNKAATAGTIRKFYSWCGTKSAKPGEYKLHVLSSMQGHVSLRWFRGEVKNSLGVIATS